MTVSQVLALSHRDYGELLDKALAQIQDGLDRGDTVAAQGACVTVTALLEAMPERGQQLVRSISALRDHPTLRPLR